MSIKKNEIFEHETGYEIPESEFFSPDFFESSSNKT